MKISVILYETTGSLYNHGIPVRFSMFEYYFN
jgi:hypothetical protein